MNTKHTKQVDTEIEVYGEIVPVRFERHFEIAYDSNYGADADGNRGMPMTFVEDDYAEDIVVDGIPLIEMTPETQTVVNQEIDSWLESNEPIIEDD